MRKFDLTKIYWQPKHYALLALFWLVGTAALAQNEITGVVLDPNEQPIPGASIIEKGTSKGTVSDANGNYSISVADGATLIFSFIGFTTREVPVGGRSTINVTLEESLEMLQEVVVIGYGSQLKETISGSVSQIDTEPLQNLPQVGIDQMLQGRAAGVTITQNSGRPGSAVSVRIRGVNSIQGSSEPLYIIDGVPVSGDSRNIASSGRSIIDNGLGEDAGVNDVSPLAALNPNDVESVVVLKDASATAIYGSRGSNGVVLITTKKGKNQKATLSYNAYGALQRPTNMIDVLDLRGYAILQNEIAEIYGLNEQVEFLNPDLLGNGTNWQQEIFDDAWMQNHQLSFSGGKEDVNYFISASYVDQEGTVIGSGFDRVTMRANLNAQLSEWISTGISLTASRTDEQVTLNNSSNGIISLSLLNNPATAVYNPDGSFAGPVTQDEIAFGLRNPIAEALSIENDLRRDKLLGNIFLEFNLIDNLTFRTEFGGNIGNNTNTRFQPTFSYGAIDRGVNQLNIRQEKNDFWIVKNFLTYSNTFIDRHEVTLMVGQEAQESSWEGTIAQDGEFVGNDVPILGTGNANDFTDQYKGSTALSSYFGRLIYTFDNKYSLTASMRADGSSNFAEGNKWGYFPSVSAAWQVSEEAFLQGFTALQNIKVYGGYGEVGNQQVAPFSYGSRLNTVSTDLGTGFEYANFANPGLVWESSTQVNLGVDFSLFNTGINATVEAYNKVSKDFLFQFAATDFITGGNSPGAITAPWINIGEVQNKGIDITLSYELEAQIGLTWNSNLTFSHYKNEVKELHENLILNGEITLESSNQNVTLTGPGEPIGLFYGYEVIGLFRTLDDINGAPPQFGRPFEDALFSTTWLGDIKFRDVNGDGVVNTDDRTVIGNPHPDFTFGFQNSFSYKNFDLSIFMQGSYGNDVFNAIGRTLTAGNRTYTNQSPSVLDYWSVENPNASAPRLARNDTPNTNISDRYVEDGSYLRIQNVTLGYTIPVAITEKARINKFKVYGSIQNLHTFTDYSGYDPEVGLYNQQATLMGIDNGRYPTPRTFTLGVNIEF